MKKKILCFKLFSEMNYYLVKKLIPPVLNRQHQAGWTI